MTGPRPGNGGWRPGGGRPTKQEQEERRNRFYEDAIEDFQVVMNKTRRRKLWKKLYDDAMEGKPLAQQILVQKSLLRPPVPPKNDNVDHWHHAVPAIAFPEHGTIIEGEVKELESPDREDEG